jgi:hypothetical protein
MKTSSIVEQLNNPAVIITIILSFCLPWWGVQREIKDAFSSILEGYAGYYGQGYVGLWDRGYALKLQ